MGQGAAGYPLADRYREALDYRMYPLVDISDYHDDEVGKSLAKHAKHLQLHMKSQKCDSLDPILIISFLLSFRLACDTNGLNEGATVWLLHFFLERPSASTVSAPIALRSKSFKRHIEGTGNSHCGAPNYLLQSYATN